MSDTQLIKSKLDIVDFIQEYIQLKPAGTNFKGLCPFHNEKSPSFMVNRERQAWHCFGCAKGGDVFSFVQEIEGLEFVEALKLLAEKAGVQLTMKRSDIQSSQKNRLKDIHVVATKFYHHVLTKLPAAQSAMEYLIQRGLKPETIEAWQIGFVPDQWDLLTKYLLKKGFGVEDLVASGLTIKRDNADTHTGRGFYDRFRGRVMFPIFNEHADVVGFTGRVLVETEHSGGKYVNSPQTSIYDKSQVIFGLHKAKQAIRKQNMIVMVEGQMDVIACHQAGMECVVASSGTAMTEDQVRLLKRYSTHLTMAFDADAAGQAAAKRGIDIALREGMAVKIIRIPAGAGKDPDECIKKDKTVWFSAVAHAQDVMAWYVEKAFTGKDIKDPKQKQQIANELLPEIARIPFAVEKDHWLKELGALLGVDVSVLREDMAGLKAQDQVGAVHQTVSQPKTRGAVQLPDPIGELLERYLALLLMYPTLANQSLFTAVSAPFATSSLLPLYEALKMQYTAHGYISAKELSHGHADNQQQEDQCTILLMKGELDFSNLTESVAKKELDTLTQRIYSEWSQKRRKELQIELLQAEKSGNHERVMDIMKEMSQLH